MTTSRAISSEGMKTQTFTIINVSYKRVFKPLREELVNKGNAAGVGDICKIIAVSAVIQLAQHGFQGPHYMHRSSGSTSCLGLENSPQSIKVCSEKREGLGKYTADGDSIRCHLSLFLVRPEDSDIVMTASEIMTPKVFESNL